MNDIETRRRIYEEIVFNPGLHFRELQRRLNMPVGLLSYHLKVLMERGIIIVRKEGKYTRYFPNTTMTQEERKIMGALRNEVARRIVIFLLEEGRKTHREITNHFELSPSTISYHLARLVKKGILEKEIAGRESYFWVRKPEEVAFTIIKYRKSFLDRLVDNFASLWTERK